jgi:hypothetical protein
VGGTLGGEGGALGLREAEGGAVVERRAPGGDLGAAAQFELLRRLKAGVEAPGFLQLFGRRLVEREALGLVQDGVGLEAEPGEILADRGGEFGARALGVGVVEAQEEAPAAGRAAGQRPVQQRRAKVSEVETTGR